MLEPTDKVEKSADKGAEKTDKGDSPSFMKKMVKSVRKYLPRHAKVRRGGKHGGEKKERMR